MARPTTDNPKSELLQIRITKDLKELLQKEAEKNNTSLASLCSQWLVERLNDNSPLIKEEILLMKEKLELISGALDLHEKRISSVEETVLPH